MGSIRVSQLPQSTILRLYSEKNLIQTDPEYQRMGEVWTDEKRQLLIDSLLNDFDLPKIYFHEFPIPKTLPDGRKVSYAIIDGRQRLETIWKFIEGDFALSDDFKLFADSSVKAGGMTYSELAVNYPSFRVRFDSYYLPVYSVTTDDLDLIEEMFLRLNEAVPLNAAEKRNAFGGPMAKAIRDISGHRFFTKNIRFSNTRYQHREMSARLLYLTSSEEIGDTKKVYLDNFVKSFKTDKEAVKKTAALQSQVEDVLDKMAKIFIEKDPLLSTQSMPIIYFLVYIAALKENWTELVTRNQLIFFDEQRAINREIAEFAIAKANYEFLEFDRMSVQGTNDTVSIRFRFTALRKFLLLEALKKGRNLTRADLRDINLDQVSSPNTNLGKLNMAGASLKSSYFTDASFVAADLTGANLARAVLTNANFSSAKLIHSNLARAELKGAKFRNADLSNANLYYAIDLEFADFTGANLEGALFTAGGSKKAKLSNEQRNIIKVNRG